MSGSKRPFSMKAFEVRTSFTSAALQADSTLVWPAEKFSMAGTRPIVCSAKNVAATPAAFGSSTPTFSPTRVIASSLWLSTCAPRMSLR